MPIFPEETNVCNFVVWTSNKTWILEIKGDKESQDELCTNLVKNWVDYILLGLKQGI